MKKTISIMILILVLFTGCSLIDAKMTKTAAKYGITDENYPKIDGSTSTLPIVETIYTSMFDDVGKVNDFPSAPSKTYPSYEKLIDGSVDIIIVPTASKGIKDLTESKGVELEYHPIASEALIFITSSENTVKDITADQIKDIYINLGIKNWNELGGEDGRLTPLARNEDSGSQAQMNNMVLKGDKMNETIVENYVELDMDGMLFQAAGYQNGGDFENSHPTKNYAIGYTMYKFLQMQDDMTGIGDRLNILSIDGIEANRQSIASGKYPFTDAYYAVIRKDLPEDHTARSIIAWLESEKGKEKLKENGYIIKNTN